MAQYGSANAGENSSIFGCITYTEILSRASANIEGEIKRTRESSNRAHLSCSGMLDMLKSKLLSIQTMYFIETGSELKVEEFVDDEK